MGIRNIKREELRRIECKNLDARFTDIMRHGLNCSPFEAQAVLNAVHEVYHPFMDDTCTTAPPGKVTLVAVSADESAGKAVADCEKVTVCLTVHRGAEDDRLLVKDGPAAWRRARLLDLCQQALSQGALLTREDLAHHVFFVGTRTISRDLAALRRQTPEVLIPLRSTLQDMGPVLTHRVQIVRLALEGKTTSQICDIMRHSPAAVTNYLSTFTRCLWLKERGLQVGQIAFLVRRGKGLVGQYLELAEACRGERNMEYHLAELLRLGGGEGEKKSGGRADHGRHA
jgi:hypothetical protein